MGSFGRPTPPSWLKDTLHVRQVGADPSVGLAWGHPFGATEFHCGGDGDGFPAAGVFGGRGLGWGVGW